MATKLVTRDSLVEDLRVIHNKIEGVEKRAKSENRSPNSDEVSFIESMTMEGDRLMRAIDRQGQLDELSKPSPRLTRAAQPIDHNGGSSMRNSDSQWVDKFGNRIHALKKEERMADLYRDSRYDSLSFGRTIKGIVTGRWGDASMEQRTMSGGSAIAGGYLIPSPISSTVIDMARNQAVCLQAGATTIPMDSDTLSIVRVTDGGTVGLHGENESMTASDVTFDRVNLVPRTFYVFVKSSRELAEDAPDFESRIASEISKELAAELDKQCLVGQSVGGIGLGGLQNVGTINTVTSVGTPTTWTKWVTGLGAVWQDNHKPNAFITNGRDATTLADLRDSTGQPMRKPDAIGELQHFITNSLPTTDSDGAGSSSYVGDFSQMLIGVRTDIVVEVSTHGEAFEKHQLWIKATARMDMSVAHLNAFCRLSGITG